MFYFHQTALHCESSIMLSLLIFPLNLSIFSYPSFKISNSSFWVKAHNLCDKGVFSSNFLSQLRRPTEFKFTCLLLYTCWDTKREDWSLTITNGCTVPLSTKGVGTAKLYAYQNMITSQFATGILLMYAALWNWVMFASQTNVLLETKTISFPSLLLLTFAVKLSDLCQQDVGK